MRLFCILALAVAMLQQASGSLGDDDEKIDAMYGYIAKRHLRDDGSVSVLYHNEKYYFFVVFKDLHTISEAYARGDGTKLSRKEIARFLQANAGRSRWPANGISAEGRIERVDHKAEAVFTEIDGRLMLQVKSKGS